MHKLQQRVVKKNSVSPKTVFQTLFFFHRKKKFPKAGTKRDEQSINTCRESCRFKQLIIPFWKLVGTISADVGIWEDAIACSKDFLGRVEDQYYSGLPESVLPEFDNRIAVMISEIRSLVQRKECDELVQCVVAFPDWACRFLSFGSPETKRGHFQPFLGGHGKCSAGSSVFNVDGSVLGRFSSLSKDFILSTNLSR
jgi:hypothetical protein